METIDHLSCSEKPRFSFVLLTKLFENKIPNVKTIRSNQLNK